MNRHIASSAAAVARPYDPRRRGTPRGVSIRQLPGWLAHGLSIARQRPVWWLFALLACADAATLFELAPRLALLAPMAAPLAAAVLVLMQERATHARAWSFGEAWLAVAEHRSTLFTIGCATAAIAGAGYAAAHGLRQSHLMPADPLEAEALALLVALPCYALALALFWFAPALVVLRRASAGEAMLASARAVLRNLPIALVYAFALGADALAAPWLPVALRALVVTPLLAALVVLGMYASYRALLGDRWTASPARG
ncbi:BPSS1780 family membrane protein [Burkholderia gladioli]|uniref:BPSS1780 family membrane protein n=1 Tax=Burkholderia gladioli TaxID=28095 RepID=UPI00163FC667|nr:BPSS1780 family membrane protein [Burkholderia gladioli]MDN7750109.1 BPSS1780 family membrane protein [Burkholderia gladioli]